MAHAPALLRTNTAPVFPANNNSNSPFSNILVGSSSSNMYGRASQLSGTTANTSASHTSLSSMAGPVNGGPVMANANIINQVADASKSLYQICVSLRNRLALVPGFESYLDDLDSGAFASPDGDGGPVESIWNLLRTGFPLLVIYNSLGSEPIKVDSSANEAKRSKIAVFKFVEACLKTLQIPPTECFVINDLTGDDTSGFVKVTQVVNRVLDLASENGRLKETSQPYPEDMGPMEGGPKLTMRDHIVRELVNTERKYVQDLENLHDLKNTLEQRGVIPGDTVHQIFLNINAILNFQRRFLIRVETTNSMPETSQRWGAPFTAYEEAFDTYHPFIANQRKAAQIANNVMEKIRTAEHPVACDFNTLDGFLLKPMQRLVKYPLLLKELLKKGSEDDDAKEDLNVGIAAAERVLKKANEAVDRDLLDEALEDLIGRVDDWKNHKVEQFGKLLRHGVYTVITGRSEQEKDYEIYLFESILLCCKEVIPNKDKSKKDKTKSAPRPRNKNNKLQLKGRIFMTNVTDVVSLQKPGSYTVQIWWKGDPGVENFVIKFSNEELMKKWAAGLETQRKVNVQGAASPQDPTQPEFTWMRNTPGLENPYAQQDEEDDDEEHSYNPHTSQMSAPPGYGPSTGGVISRNVSSTSLRARSTTNESTQSLAAAARAMPSRFPMPAPGAPLSVHTQGGQSPGQVAPRDSYFSPTAESPASSSRTSNASTLHSQHNPQYPFPRTSTPQSGWEDHNRYTAPAMPRAPSRDGPSPVHAANPYGSSTRGPRGPSLPVMASQPPPSIAQQQRSRSYSTPDINGQPNGRRTNSNVGVPAVPGIPAHLHPAHDSNIPRSQTGSPRQQDLPMRSNTQSPGQQRERMGSVSGGSMSQFPTQPIYGRQPTPSTSSSHTSGTPQPLNISNSNGVPVSPPLGTASTTNQLSSPELPIPTQLKVKVHTEGGTYFTLVVAFNITYQSLIDRIDAKLGRFTNSSIGKGNLRLRYRDEDGDFVTIESDDDIQIAFLEWREGVHDMYSGGVGEIELFCVGDTN